MVLSSAWDTKSNPDLGNLLVSSLQFSSDLKTYSNTGSDILSCLLFASATAFQYFISLSLTVAGLFTVS